MGANQFGKCRDVEEPYAVYIDVHKQFETRVLKTYQTREKEQDNSSARWFVAVKSPYTFGSWEYGDSYVRNVLGDVVQSDPLWEEEYVLPALRLKAQGHG
tara:strand:+ start:1178 stop:1477 length:300 start_codon:yes stop_codon:yes gene_type:complete